MKAEKILKELKMLESKACKKAENGIKKGLLKRMLQKDNVDSLREKLKGSWSSSTVDTVIFQQFGNPRSYALINGNCFAVKNPGEVQFSIIGLVPDEKTFVKKILDYEKENTL